MNKKILMLSFFFQAVALIAYIFLFDVLTYISVFTLWLGAILSGFHIKELIPDQDSYFKGISRSGGTPKDSRKSGGTLSESLSLQGGKEFAENGSISCKNSIDR